MKDTNYILERLSDNIKTYNILIQGLDIDGKLYAIYNFKISVAMLSILMLKNGGESYADLRNVYLQELIHLGCDTAVEKFNRTGYWT